MLSLKWETELVPPPMVNLPVVGQLQAVRHELVEIDAEGAALMSRRCIRGYYAPHDGHVRRVHQSAADGVVFAQGEGLHPLLDVAGLRGDEDVGWEKKAGD